MHQIDSYKIRRGNIWYKFSWIIICCVISNQAQYYILYQLLMVPFLQWYRQWVSVFTIGCIMLAVTLEIKITGYYWLNGNSEHLGYDVQKKKMKSIKSIAFSWFYFMHYRSLCAALQFKHTDTQSHCNTISIVISCAYTSMTLLVAVDIALLRYYRSTSMGIIHMRVDSICIWPSTTQ